MPYSYVWQTSPVQTSVTAIGLSPGTYTVIVSDANKCTFTKTVSITQPASALSNTITSTQSGCNVSTGTASVTVTGGTPGYTYLWNTTPQQTAAHATGIPSGSYSVLVTDNNGCTIPGTIYVSVVNGPTITATVIKDVTCSGTNDGSAISSTVGGIMPYEYLWLPSNQTTDNATGLFAQTHTVHVTDRNNCKSFSTVTVKEPPKLDLSSAISVTNVSCYMGSNGTATITPTGGTPGYTYVWSTLPAQTSSIAIGLSANTVYSVTVTDAYGCAGTASITLKHPTPLVSAIYNFISPSCFGYTDGAIIVSAAGGTPAYTYLWLPTNQTTSLATGLGMDSYTVTITDAHGCTDITQINLTEPAPVTLSASVSGFSCAGLSKDGSASAFPNGGTPPYSFLWSPTSQTTQTISNIPSGSYSVTLTDSKGCAIVANAVLISSNKPDAKFSYTSTVSCDGVVVTFADESTPSSITQWKWSFGNGATSSSQNPSYVYPYSSGYHDVTLLVYEAPCYDTVKTAVIGNDLYNYILFDDKTNIFTPNNDGVNDCFMPYIEGNGATALKECLELRVYDRWGIIMFESEGANNCWNGKNMRDKKPAVDGTYFYVAKLAGKIIKGYCTLVTDYPNKKW